MLRFGPSRWLSLGLALLLALPASTLAAPMSPAPPTGPATTWTPSQTSAGPQAEPAANIPIAHYQDPALQTPTGRAEVQQRLAAPFMPQLTKEGAPTEGARRQVITPREAPPPARPEPASTTTAQAEVREHLAWGPEYYPRTLTESPYRPDGSSLPPLAMESVRSKGSVQPMAAAAYGYTLTLDKDTLATNETKSFAATLTRYGAPVLGARIQVGHGGAYGVYYTDAAGQASFTVTAPSYSDIIPLYVDTPAFTGPLGELYAVPPGYGVVIVEGITEPDGTPISRFNLVAQLKDGDGIWGWSRFTGAGLSGIIQPAGLTHIAVTVTESATPYYLYQQVNLAPGERRVVTPSTDETVQVTTGVTLDGAVQSFNLYLHNEQIGEAIYHSNALPASIRVTPGTYSLSLLTWLGAPDPMLLTRSGVALVADQSLTFAESRTGLARLSVDLADGHGVAPPALDWFSMTLKTPLQLLHLTNGYRSLLVTPDSAYQITRYDMTLLDGESNWSYHFSPTTRPAVTPHAGETATLALGGPLQLFFDFDGCRLAGCTLQVWRELKNAANDYVPVIWRPDGSFVQGTFQVEDANGLLLDSGSLDMYTPLTWTIPSNATLGTTYTLRVSYDLGPYQGAVTHEQQITVGASVVDAYELALSQQMVDTYADVAITATLTNGGLPVPGAELEIGYGAEYGTFTTDSNGQATISFQAPDWNAEIPIRLYAENVWARRISEIYVVPSGFGVLIIDGVTDQTGAPVADWTVNAYYSGPEFDSFTHAGHTPENGYVGMVRPAGLNHVEASADSLYLYQQANVPAKGIKRLQLSGLGAVSLSLSATVDGAARSGSVLLHNEALPDASWIADSDRTGAAVYVTPGTYTLMLLNQMDPLLLHRSGVLVTKATNLTLPETSANLGRLGTSAVDGYGQPIPVEYLWLELPGFELSLDANQEYLVQPGIELNPTSYWMAQEIIPEATRRVQASNFGPDRAVRTVAGTVSDLGLGGPVTYNLAYRWGCLEPGCKPWFTAGLYNAQGDQFDFEQNWTSIRAALTLQDATGAVVGSYENPTYNSSIRLNLPADSLPPYTLTAEVDPAPYQAPLETSYPFGLNQPVTVALSQKVLTPGQAHQIEIQVNHDGEGIPGALVTLGYGRYGEYRTDAQGHVSVSLTPVEVGVIPVDLSGANIAQTRTNLFALSPGFAGVEVSGSDEQGAPLTNYWATAASVGSSDWVMDSSPGGSVGLILPAGETYVELMREGSPLYLLGQTLSLPGDSVTPVHLSAEGLTPTTLTATLDGAPLDFGSIAFHRNETGTNRHVWLNGAALDEEGTAPAFITPGTYAAQVVKLDGPDPLMATFRDLNLNGGPLNLPVQRAALGALQTHTTIAGVEYEHARYISTAEFDRYIPGPVTTLLATPDLYTSDYMYLQLPQPSGAIWEQGFTGSPPPFTVEAGRTTNVWWPMEITRATAWALPATYRPGDEIRFGMELATADDWLPGFLWADRPGPGKVSYTITDAAGVTVSSSSNASLPYDLFTIPGAASPSYTIILHRDLAQLGAHTVHTTINRAVEYEIWLERDTVPVGPLNAVPIRVTRNGLPVRNTDVTLQGEYDRLVHLDPNGRANLPIKATYTGLWQVSIGGATASIMALEPGYGVVDIVATDQDGAPLQYVSLSGTPSYFTQYRNGEPVAVVVRAGRQRIALRGASPSGDNYYMHQEIDVPDQGRARFLADGQQTEALQVSFTGAATTAPGALTIRSRDLQLTEWQSLPMSLGPSATVYVTPGAYEALLSLRADRIGYFLRAPNVDTAVSTELTFDATTASAQLQLSGQDGHGAPVANTSLWLYQGGIGLWLNTGLLDQIYLTPGTYTLDAAQLNLENPSTDERWAYVFLGPKALNLAAQTTSPLVIGGALTASIGPAAPVNPVGTTAKIIGGARDGNGLILAWADVYDRSTGSYKGSLGNQVTVSGYGTSTTLHYYGETAYWPTPSTQGTYTLQFSMAPNPYGPIPTATGTIRVTAPLRPRP